MTKLEKELAVLLIHCEAMDAREKHVTKKIEFKEICQTRQITEDERVEWKAIIGRYEFLERFYESLATKVETILNSQTTDPETV